MSVRVVNQDSVLKEARDLVRNATSEVLITSPWIRQRSANEVHISNYFYKDTVEEQVYTGIREDAPRPSSPRGLDHTQRSPPAALPIHQASRTQTSSGQKMWDGGETRSFSSFH